MPSGSKGIEVKINHGGMKQLLKSAGVRAELTQRAEAVLQAAIDDPHDDTGEYEGGLEIQQHTTDRAVVRVVGTDWKSGILEAEYGILARALDSAQ
jgi:hypothetical protein